MTSPTTLRTFLPATPPFDFAASLRFIQEFPAMAGEQATEQGVLTAAVREAGVLVGVRLSAAQEACGLACELVAAEPVSESAQAAIADRLTFYLGLDDDLTEFYALAAADPPFAAVVEKLRGYHQVKFPSPLELMCWAILCQRVPMPVARKMKHAIVEECGNRVEVGGRELWAFPDLEQLLAISEERLVELVGNKRKAAYLYAALREWTDFDEHFLRTGDYEAVCERLLSLPGIGPWSARFLLIRGLGRMEQMSADREALRTASKVYGHPVDEAEFARLAERYGRWQGYWGHYLRVGG
jgi:DNA-3-methyladenine glycosylase II